MDEDRSGAQSGWGSTRCRGFARRQRLRDPHDRTDYRRVTGGLGGAAITAGYLGTYTDGVTAGRGYVALAIVITGRWSPFGALAGALLFAFFDSLALGAQNGASFVPVEAYMALPYLVTLLVLVLTARGTAVPRAWACPISPIDRLILVGAQKLESSSKAAVAIMERKRRGSRSEPQHSTRCCAIHPVVGCRVAAIPTTSQRASWITKKTSPST